MKNWKLKMRFLQDIFNFQLQVFNLLKLNREKLQWNGLNMKVKQC